MHRDTVIDRLTMFIIEEEAKSPNTSFTFLCELRVRLINIYNGVNMILSQFDNIQTSRRLKFDHSFNQTHIV